MGGDEAADEEEAEQEAERRAGEAGGVPRELLEPAAAGYAALNAALERRGRALPRRAVGFGSGRAVGFSPRGRVLAARTRRVVELLSVHMM
ncbi:hypothetical protein [Streptomyces sp. NPDC018610]|uniref:hypothetical protein n=1 Tax=Streptomyces sp. NPDC018610 TaxID=3365049 RepID=UPI0037A06700